MKSEKLLNLTKLLISVLVIFFIINFIGTEKISEALLKIRLEYFILIAVFFVVSMILTTLAIMPLIKTKKTWKIFKFKTISWSTGMFLPSKIGEASFPLLLKKTGIPTKKAITIFFIDRFASFSIIGLFSLFGFLKYFEITIDLSYLLIFLAVFLILLIIKNKIKSIKRIQKIFSLIKETEEYLKKEKKAVLINYLFSFINFILLFWVTQIIFYSIGQKINLIDIALISSFSLFIGLIPITINGLGIREGTSVYLYSLIGVKPEYSILVALIFFISTYLLGAVFLGLFYNEFSFILKRKGTENV